MRRPATLALLSTLLTSVLASPSQFSLSPFLQPLVQQTFEPSPSTENVTSVEVLLIELHRRQSDCPANFDTCSNLGAAGACCTSGTSCQTDRAGHIACCPDGSSCTGTIDVGTQSASSGASSSSGFVLGGSTTTSMTSQSTSSTSSSSVSTTGGFAYPSQTVAGNAGFTAASTISNQFFAFGALPTTFPNAQECSSGYAFCQTQFSSCTAKLGGTNGVTVSAPGAGAGVTVQGGPTTLGPSATSICSSLSSQACHGLVESSCSLFGTGTGVVANANAAAPTGCAHLYGMGLGVAIGVAGHVLG
ncbi:MAG: hypothetical protein M4579_003919 [Chaenotheca gracillima]|nr:MAG: hypothetical protein M4579_003919 [Chaenotheca gracillima]